MRRPENNKNVKEKIHIKGKEKLQHDVGNFVWVRSGGRRENGRKRKKFSVGERRAQRRMKLFAVLGLTEPRQPLPQLRKVFG